MTIQRPEFRMRSGVSSFVIRHLVFPFLLAVTFCVLRAEIPKNVVVEKEMNVPVYEGTNFSAILSASKAQPLMGGKGEVLLLDFEVTKFGKTTNEIEFIVRAAECYGSGLFEAKDKRVWSHKNLQIHDGLTNYFIEGEGFVSVLGRSNVTTTISNRVHTLLQRESTNNQPKPPLEIFSDHFHFVSETQTKTPKRIATYTRNVRVDDRETVLTCEKLVIEPDGTNKVRHIQADHNVVITNKSQAGRATGERAVYVNENGRELIRLTGNPIWRDARNEGHADTFIFDPRTRMIFANENARLKLPRAALASGAFFNAKTNAAATNDYVEIFSDHFGIQTSTNRAGSLVARKNVVILSPADQTRATADEAFFDEATGRMELKGNASWQNDQFSAAGRMLELDRTNQFFKASGNSRFKMLASNVKRSSGGTSQFVEIFSDSYEIRTNVARFFGNVRASFLQGNTPGKLTSHFLEVGLSSNEVETLLAQGNVQFEQILTTTTNDTQRTISGELLTLKRSPITGLTRSIIAETNVVMLETERAKTGHSQRWLKGDLVTMLFSTTTNQLESLVAEGAVEIEQGDNHVLGGRAVYRTSLEGDTIEVTGEPVAIVKVQDSFFRQAGERLVVERATGKVRWSGLRETVPVSQALEKNVKSSSSP